MVVQRHNLTGKQFGFWTALSYLGRLDGIHSSWLCECVCGIQKPVLTFSLTSGKSKGCSSCTKIKHGKFGTNIYNTYYQMLARCYNPKHHAWERYGGRGIKVSDRWLGEEGFKNFYADVGDIPEGKTLDRFPDPDGNYEKNNVRWATDKEQANNRSRKTSELSLR